MSLQSYIEKLRAKPVHERKRIAIGVTIVGFFLFAAIWVVSLKEMNKSVEPQADQTSASLNDLKNNFQDNLQTGKDSIQNMMQQLPSEASPAAPTDNSGAQPSNDSLNSNDSATNPESILAPTENNSSGQNNQDKPAVPQLP
jgi:predicted PurR-regulated permease PerM